MALVSVAPLWVISSNNDSWQPIGLGDDPQKSSLDVFDSVVEQVQQVPATGDGRLGQHLRPVPMRVSLAQRMPVRQLPAPIEHLFPVGHVAGGGGLDQQAGISRLAVAVGRNELLLDVLGHREEVGKHSVRAVEEILRQIMAGVHEARRQTAADTVDDRGALSGGAALERQQIDIKNVIHRPIVAPSIPPGRTVNSSSRPKPRHREPGGDAILLK